MVKLKVQPIGHISGVHGNEGMLKVIPFENQHDKFENLKKVYLMNDKGELFPCEIWEIRKYIRGRYLVKLNGFKNRGQVKNFKHYTLVKNI